MSRILQCLYRVYFRPRDRPGVYAIFGTRGTVYLGSSMSSVRHRVSSHISRLRRGVHHNALLQNAFNDGEIFCAVMIEYFPPNCSPVYVDRREEYWISVFTPVCVNVPFTVRRARKEERQ